MPMRRASRFADPAPADPPPPAYPALPALVGRDQDVREVLGLLAEPEFWGVQLHGGPGIGKSRLARAVAAAVPGQVLTVDLRTYAEAESEAEGEAGPYHPAVLAVAELLGERDPLELIVLDGLDRLSPAALRHVLDTARARADRCLVALRQPVDVAGLRPYRVCALPVPLDSSALDLAGLARVASVRLFADRVRDLHPGFRVDHANQHLVARICAELRGVPDALCRAAQVAGTEGLEAFSAAVDERSAPARTDLAALVDSYGGSYGSRASGAEGTADTEGLDPVALRLLGHARVFTGGFGAEALRTVAGVGRSDALEPLVARHLLAVSALPSGTLDGLARVRLHLPAASVAAAAAALPDPADARRAHARYYAGLARAAARRIRAGDQYTGVAAFHGEERNIGAALETLLAAGAYDEAVDLVDSACHYWRATGRPFAWATRLALLEGLSGAGEFEARNAVGAGAGAAAATPATAARAGLIQAEARARAGEPEAARVQIALAEPAAAADPALAARLLHVRGLTEHHGVPGASVALLRQSLVRWREVGDRHAACHVLLDLAAAHFFDGDAEAATLLAQEVVADAVSRADFLNSGTALLQLSAYAAAGGRAAGGSGAGGSAAGGSGAGAPGPDGRVAGAAARAEEYFHRALASLRGLGAVAVLGSFVRVVAGPMRPGMSDRAFGTVRLLGGFYASREAILGAASVPDFAVSGLEQPLRRLLGDQDFTRALREGAALRLVDQIAQLGGGTVPVPSALSAGFPGVPGAVGVSGGSGAGGVPGLTGSPGVPLAPPRAPTTYATGNLSAGFGGVLTARQSEVCELVTEGMSNKQIARRLQISEWTVVNHMREIMRKLDCTSRVGVASRVLTHRAAEARTA
ncbi:MULTISPECIES: LuxR C-terminal-related transcriptional regulator [unclassified Streptomyces]|uniref:LuxR C-terminal-related transcriptional regulator n=1 Tax=unclassified Streptomyces TaxID=2593676 RepID=UPI002E29F8DA|nr:LuxR C-terminal-related transcriptional regulator [Streptomyces sp. NBC_00223]